MTRPTRCHAVGFALVATLSLCTCGDGLDAIGETQSSGIETQTDADADPGTFPPMGPLVGTPGESSFWFGGASAATQIEDQNERTATLYQQIIETRDIPEDLRAAHGGDGPLTPE